MLKALRVRFVIITMSIVTVMLLVIFGMVYHFTEKNLESQSISMLHTVSLTPDFPMRPGESRPQVNLPFFSVRKENGIWVAEGSGYYDLSDREYLQEIVQEADAREEYSGVLRSYSLRYLRSDTPIGTMIVFADITSEMSTLRHLIRTCAIIGLVSLAVFFGISVLLARWAIAPVDKAWQQQKQFVADASHELKTPLTVIETSTDLLCQADDEGERARCTDNIREMSHRMRDLVEEMLILARSDSGKSKEEKCELSLSRTVSDALLPFEPIFFEAGLTLSSDIAEGVTVRGEAGALRQLTDILLDNARKYSLPGGETVVLLRSSGKRALLCISNPSAEMTAEQCREVFKRFYRTDASRTGGGSFGLGLSIAESIVQRHGGKIRAEYGGGIFSVTAELPIGE